MPCPVASQVETAAFSSRHVLAQQQCFETTSRRHRRRTDGRQTPDGVASRVIRAARLVRVPEPKPCALETATTNRRGSCFGTYHAELVALGVGKNGPGLGAGLPEATPSPGVAPAGQAISTVPPTAGPPTLTSNEATIRDVVPRPPAWRQICWACKQSARSRLWESNPRRTHYEAAANLPQRTDQRRSHTTGHPPTALGDLGCTRTASLDRGWRPGVSAAVVMSHRATLTR
jgi:hypothetical protein